MDELDSDGKAMSDCELEEGGGAEVSLDDGVISGRVERKRFSISSSVNWPTAPDSTPGSERNAKGSSSVSVPDPDSWLNWRGRGSSFFSVCSSVVGGDPESVTVRSSSSPRISSARSSLSGDMIGLEGGRGEEGGRPTDQCCRLSSFAVNTSSSKSLLAIGRESGGVDRSSDGPSSPSPKRVADLEVPVGGRGGLVRARGRSGESMLYKLGSLFADDETRGVRRLPSGVNRGDGLSLIE